MTTRQTIRLGGMLLVLACVCWSSAPLTAGERLRHLFLDPTFAQQAEGAALHVNPPERREVVIRPDRPWEQLMITFFVTVREEAGKLRMWYICRDRENRPNVAYAESADGVHWAKPPLGIVDYEGSKENNLVGLTALEGTVFDDPNAPAAERYAYVTHVFGEGVFRFHSPDGLHWQRDETPLLTFGADTQASSFWDERLGKYVLYLRAWQRKDDRLKYRQVVRLTPASLTSPIPVEPTEKSVRLWGKDKPPVIGDEFPTVLAADEHDPPNTDVYNLSAVPYPLDRRWLVAFPSWFQRERHTSDGRLEVQFAGSTDGIAWHRYDRKPYAPLGLADSDRANMTFMGVGMIVRGDEIWQYGTGYWSRHGDFAARKLKTDGVIYRYVQRIDGFVSLDFANDVGRATTAAVEIDGPQLLLNVDTGALGTLRVGLLDENGKELTGFEIGQCDPIRTNSTHVAVSWQEKSDLKSLAGRKVRLTLTGNRARVFSFYFGKS